MFPALHLHEMQTNRQTLTEASSQPTTAMPQSLNCLLTTNHGAFCWVLGQRHRASCRCITTIRNLQNIIVTTMNATTWQCLSTSHLTLAQTQLSFCPLPCPWVDWQLHLMAASAQLAHMLLSARNTRDSAIEEAAQRRRTCQLLGTICRGELV